MLFLVEIKKYLLDRRQKGNYFLYFLKCLLWNSFKTLMHILYLPEDRKRSSRSVFFEPHSRHFCKKHLLPKKNIYTFLEGSSKPKFERSSWQKAERGLFSLLLEVSFLKLFQDTYARNIYFRTKTKNFEDFSWAKLREYALHKTERGLFSVLFVVFSLKLLQVISARTIFAKKMWLQRIFISRPFLADIKRD